MRAAQPGEKEAPGELPHIPVALQGDVERTDPGFCLWCPATGQKARGTKDLPPLVFQENTKGAMWQVLAQSCKCFAPHKPIFSGTMLIYIRFACCRGRKALSCPRSPGRRGSKVLVLLRPCLLASCSPPPLSKGFPIPRDLGSLRYRNTGDQPPAGELPTPASPSGASQQKTVSGRGEQWSSTLGRTCLPRSRPLQHASGTQAFVFSTPFLFLFPFSCYFTLFFIYFFLRLGPRQ